MRLDFSWNFGRKVPHSKNNLLRYYHKCTHSFMSSTRHSSQIWIKLLYFQHFFLYPQIWNFMKIRPVWAELFYADRQTDTTKLTADFRNFANWTKYRLAKGHLSLLNVNYRDALTARNKKCLSVPAAPRLPHAWGLYVKQNINQI